MVDQVTDEDRDRAKLLRRLLQARQKMDAAEGEQGFEVVQRIGDGAVYRDAQGLLSFRSPGYSTSNQEEIQLIMQGRPPGMARTETTQRQIIEEAPFASRAAAAVRGVPFVGEFAEEIAGRITGEPQTTAAMREAATAMGQQRPVETFGLQAGMGAAATAPLVPAGAISALGAQPLGRQMLQTGAAGILGGATEGAVSGFGAGTGTAEERLKTAQTGAMLGGLFGGVIGAAAPVVTTGVRNLLTYWRNKPLREAAKNLGISEDATRVVMAFIDEGDFAGAQAALQRGGSQSMLADVSQNTKNLLDAALVFGSGGDQARSAILARNLRGEQEARGAFNKFLGEPVDLATIQGQIRGSTAEAREAAYQAAYSTPINYASLGGRKLENWQRFIPPEAMNEANKLIRTNPAARGNQILFRENPDGSISFEELPSLEQWDYITRALNDIAFATPAGKMGGKSAYQQQAANNAREIRKLLIEQVPEYAQALGIARNTIEEINAAEVGYSLLTPSVRVREVVDLMDDPSPAVRDAVKQGMRAYLDTTLGNLRVTAANPNTEIKELTSALSLLRSRNNRNKVEAVLGDDADEFYRILDEQATGIELANAVAVNSKTAQRQGIQKTVGEVTDTGILGNILRAEPVDATKAIVQSITGKTPEADAARQMGIYDDIALVLTQLQGQRARDALGLIRRAKNGATLSNAQARIIAGAITTPAAIGAYRALVAGTTPREAQQ